MALSDKELEKQLREAGNKLLSPPPSAAELLISLDRVESLLTRVEQSPSESMKKALSPSMKALVTSELLRHSDVDVKVSVASCISEITRITAPDAPYEDDEMKEVFRLIVSTFENLDDINSPSYVKRTSILETVAKVRSCVVMLDLECDALIADMFQHFFKTIRSEHSENVVSSMETIMTLVLEESEEISVDLLSSILNVLKLDDKEVLAVARQLGEKVTEKCASKLKPYLLPAMKSRGTTVEDYSKVVANVFQGGSEAIEHSGADAANKNVADENDVANAPSEKAVEVALETLDDAPPTEEAVPAVAGSPKSVVSNGAIQKDVEGTSVADDTSKEVSHDSHGEAEPSKNKVDSSDAEELIKLRVKPEKAKKRKGKKTNSVKSSSEPTEPALVDEKEEDKTAETEEQDGKAVDNAQNEAPVIDSAEPAENEKESEAPVPTPKTSDEPADLPSPSPSGGSLADETVSKKADQEKKKDELVESVPADGGLEKKPDAKKSSEDSIPESKLHKGTGKKVSPEKEDSVPSSVDVSTKEEDEKTCELDAKTAEPIGNQQEDKKKQGQGKGTPTKDLAKTPAKDEGKKSTGPAKSSAKKASKLSSKRKRSSGKKVPKYGEELVGSRVQVWWPDDKEFYEGVIESFDPATGKHKVLYNDGDVEHLKFEKEKWKLIADGSVPDQGHSSDGETLEPAETPKAKKVKSSPVQGTKQAKTDTSTKKAGASSSKSKATPKSRTKQKDDSKVDGKAKDETLKSIGKSEDKGGKAKESKSGNKTSDNTPKSVGKSKDNDDVDTSKVGSSKSKLETPKTASKSKGKSSKNGSKSNTNSSSKAKATSSAMEEETEDVESSPEPVKAPENSKGKSQSGSKSKKSAKPKATLSAMEEETENVESSPEPVKAPESSKGKSQSGSKSKKSAKKRKRGTKG